MSAFGCGQFLWPPIGEYLLRTYSLSGMLVIIAGIQLHSCALSAMIRPFYPGKENTLYTGRANVSQVHMSHLESTTHPPSRDSSLKEEEQQCSAVQNSRCVQCTDETISPRNIKDLCISYQVQKEESCSDRRDMHQISSQLGQKYEGNMLCPTKYLPFTLFMFGLAIGSFGMNVDHLYLPTVGVVMGQTDQQAAFLVSILSKISFTAL